MKLTELRDICERYLSTAQNYRKDLDVCVVIKTSGSIGGTPVVAVKNCQVGFDWNSGKFMIYTEEPVMKVDQMTLDTLRKEAEKIGWDRYENSNLKAEVAKLRKKLNDTR